MKKRKQQRKSKAYDPDRPRYIGDGYYLCGLCLGKVHTSSSETELRPTGISGDFDTWHYHKGCKELLDVQREKDTLLDSGYTVGRARGEKQSMTRRPASQ